MAKLFEAWEINVEVSNLGHTNFVVEGWGKDFMSSTKSSWRVLNDKEKTMILVGSA